jgi:Uri superfamily endonuclease
MSKNRAGLSSISSKRDNVGTPAQTFPKEPGSYLLILDNPVRQRIAVGRLGLLSFEAGRYVYVGSAMGGLSRRVTRYMKTIEKPHWHIDTLLPVFHLHALYLFPSPIRLECRIARIVSKLSQSVPVPGFGSTDCRCLSHLFNITRIKKAPLFDILKGALQCRKAEKRIYS